MPALRERITRDAHAYYRFTTPGFASAVCSELASTYRLWPIVNLHGDAHLEQFAVTADGSGLADFDYGTLGPAPLDLLRFAVSIRLAAHDRRLEPRAAIAALLGGYRAGLSGQAPPPVPTIATLLRTQLPDRPAFLAKVEASLDPVPDTLRAEVDTAVSRLLTQLGNKYPELGAGFFRARSVGIPNRTAIGGLPQRRFLVRIEGPTKALHDDVVLEGKELAALHETPCVQPLGGAMRVLISRARLGLASTTRFLAVVERSPDLPYDAPPSWVQEWRHDYRELQIADLRSQQDLVAIASRVGFDLGRGHPAYVGSPLDAELKRVQRRTLDEFEPELYRAIDALYQRTIDSWQALRRELAKDAPVPVRAPN